VTPRARWTGDLVMVGTAMLMGSSYPFAKEVLAGLGPLLFSGSRYLLAAAFLFAAMALMRRPLGLPARDLPAMLLLAILGVTFFQSCWGLAIERTQPSLGSILMTTTTAFSALIARANGRVLPAAGWLGIAIAFAGVVLVVNNDLTRVTLGAVDPVGAALWLVAAFAWALYVDRGAPFNARLGALRVMAWTTLLGAGLLVPLALLVEGGSGFARLDDQLWSFWLYTAIFPVGVAFLGLTYGLDRLGVGPVMVYMYLIPVAGVGLSVLFFGDELTLARAVGGLVVLAGVVVTRRALDRVTPAPV